MRIHTTTPSMTLTREAQRSLAIVALAALATVVTWRWFSTTSRATLAERLAVAHTHDANASWEAHVVLREADCVSNTEFLLLLQRPRVAQGVRLRAAWVIDDGGVVERASASLRARGIHTEVSLLPRAAEAQLSTIGASRTPLLVVFDDLGLVRLMTAAPRTPTEFAALSTTLESLRQTF